MLGRLIRISLPISGVCRSCTKSTSLQKYLQVDLGLESSNKRYIKTFCQLRYSVQNPKEKRKIINNDENPKEKHRFVDNDNKKKDEQKNTKNTNQESDKRENENGNENQETSQQNTEQNDRSRKEKRYKEEGSRRKPLPNELVLHSFANMGRKEKDTFLECIRMYVSSPGKKRDHVGFIYGALKYMEEFGVHKDLSVYKKLIDIFPKQKMIPTNMFQSMFLHYPREQYCCTALLEQMEDNGVIPDTETETLLLNIFGRHGMPLEKFWKMMYWMPKFKNLNPWPVPNPIPNDVQELAKLAMIKISSVDIESTVTIFDTNDVSDSIDKTWIVSAMAPKQSELLLKHDKKTPIYVEGPFKIYIATKSVDYFTLRAEPLVDRNFPDEDPDEVEKLRNPYVEIKTSDVILPPCIHEQIDATIFANCATGTSTKDSLLSWIRCLQEGNPVLGDIPIVFTLKNYSQDNVYIGDQVEKKILPKDNRFLEAD